MDYSNIVEKVITFIVCLILSLFLMTVITNAETLTNNEYDFIMPDDVLEVYQSKPEYTSGDYYSVCFYYNYKYEMYFVPKADNLNFKFKFQGNSNYITDGKYTRAIVGCNQTMYNLHYYGNTNAQLSILSSYNWPGIDPYYQANNYFVFWSQQDCYGSDWTTVTFPDRSSNFIPPSFMPPSFTDSLPYLQTGEFIAFQIDPR